MPWYVSFILGGCVVGFIYFVIMLITAIKVKKQCKDYTKDELRNDIANSNLFGKNNDKKED